MGAKQLKTDTVEFKPIKPSLEFTPLEKFPMNPSSGFNFDSRSNPTDMSNLTKKQMVLNGGGDLLKLSLRGVFVYFNPYLFTAFYFKDFLKLGRDLSRGDSGAIFSKAFTRLSYFSEYQSAQKNIQEGRISAAIKIYEDLMIKMESRDQTKEKSKVVEELGCLYAYQGDFLSASISFFESATLLSSYDVHKKEEEDGTKIFINHSGLMYLYAVKYLHIYALNEDSSNPRDLCNLLEKMCNRGESAFAKESQYRSRSFYVSFAKKEIMGANLPVGIKKVAFCEDDSSGYNDELSKKLKYYKDTVVQMLRYNEIGDINEELRSVNVSEIEFPVYYLERLERSIEKVDFDLCDSFLNRFEAVFHGRNEVLGYIPFLRLKNKIIHSKYQLDDFLIIFKLLDNAKEDVEHFDFLLSCFVNLTKLLNLKDRSEIAKVMLEKNYIFSNKGVEAYLRYFAGEIYIEPILGCLYPVSEEHYQECLELLESKDVLIDIDGKGKIINHFEFRRLTSQFLDKNHASHKIAIKDNKVELDEYALLINKIENELDLHGEFANIKERLSSQVSYVGVFGITKVGKSSFINALIEKKILHTDFNVATNNLTFIKCSNKDLAHVSFIDGNKRSIPLSEVKKFTSEKFNPQNEKGVTEVDVEVKSSLPPKTVIVDIPGAYADSSKFGEHESVVSKALDVVSACVMITTPHDQLQEHELELIKKARSKKIPILLVVNKSDEIEEDEQEDLISGIQKRINNADIKFDFNDIICTSAALGLAAIKGHPEEELLGFSREEALEFSRFPQVRQEFIDICRKIKEENSKIVIEQLISRLESEKKYLSSDLQKMRDDLPNYKATIQEECEGISKIVERFKIVIDDLETNVKNDLLKLEVMPLTGIRDRALASCEEFRVVNEENWGEIVEKCEEHYISSRSLRVRDTSDYAQNIEESLKDFAEDFQRFNLALPEYFPPKKLENTSDYLSWWNIPHGTSLNIIGRCTGDKNKGFSNIAYEVLDRRLSIDRSHYSHYYETMMTYLHDVKGQLENRVISYKKTMLETSQDIKRKEVELINKIKFINDYVEEIRKRHDKV